MRRVCKFYAFTRPHDIDLARPHAVLVRVPHFSGWYRIHLIEWHFISRGFCLNEGSVKALDDCGHEFGLGIPAKLQQRLDHLREITHAAVLIRALCVNDVEHIRKAGALLVCQNAGPFSNRSAELIRVVAAYVICYHHAVLVYFHAVVYGVARFWVLTGCVVERSPGPVVVRCCDSVGLDQVDAERVGEQPSGFVLLD